MVSVVQLIIKQFELMNFLLRAEDFTTSSPYLNPESALFWGQPLDLTKQLAVTPRRDGLLSFSKAVIDALLLSASAVVLQLSTELPVHLHLPPCLENSGERDRLQTFEGTTGFPHKFKGALDFGLVSHWNRLSYLRLFSNLLPCLFQEGVPGVWPCLGIPKVVKSRLRGSQREALPVNEGRRQGTVAILGR